MATLFRKWFSVECCGCYVPRATVSTKGAESAQRLAWIGRRLRRREDPPLLVGRGRYAGDEQEPGTLHLAFRRAGVPSARVLGIDTRVAAEMPGVLGVWTFGQLGLVDDFMPDPPGSELSLRRPVLAAQAVRYEGEALAAVGAEADYLAADAVDAIEVDLEAGTPDEGHVTTQEFGFGEVEGAFADAPVVVSQHLRMGRIMGAAMEPRAAFARWDADQERLLVRASVGWVHGLRDVLAACLGLNQSQVAVVADDVGGSFGAKNYAYPEYVVCAALSRLLNRPVRWVATRSEDGHTTAQSHAVELDVEVASDPDGRVLGLRCSVDWPIGAYVTGGAMQDRNIAVHTMSAYRMPALRVTSSQRHSGSPPAAHIRGGGRPVGNFAVERIMDRLARHLAMDPLEVRRRNLIPTEAMPYATGFPGIVYDGGDYRTLLELASERVDVPSLRARQRAGERIGLGVAMCVESTGFGRPEPTRVVIRPDSSVDVYVGCSPQGQGHRTFAAQVAADRLGWPLERIDVIAGDSRAVPFSQVTAGSRTALEVGNSVALSAAGARRRLLELASDLLEADAGDLVLSESGVRVRGAPARGVALADVVGEGLEVSETWDSQGAPAFASSCHVAVVGVDGESGSVQMQRYVIAHDGGRAINPLIVDGQLQGGYAHGLGYALFEETLYDDHGTLLSPTFLDYTIASAPELACEPELIHIVTPSSQNPEGFRGAGEAGTIAVPAAIANAVEDALYAAGRREPVDTVPITPERLWHLWSRGRH